MPRPEVRRQRARIGGLTLHSRRDSRETTKAGTAAFVRSFEALVDPAGVLTPAERQRRARCALRAHMARLALKSAQVRRARRNGGR